jgi:hypothetical protein
MLRSYQGIEGVKATTVAKLASSRRPGLPVIARRSCDWRTVISVEDGLLDGGRPP